MSQSKGRHQRSPAWPIYATVIATIAATLVGSWFLNAADRDRLASIFRSNAINPYHGLRENFQFHVTSIKTIGELLEINPDLTRDEFAQVAEKHQGAFEEVQAIEWIPILPSAERNKFVQRVREEGFRDFQLKRWSSQSGWTSSPSEWAELYAPVHYIYPMNGNEAAHGIDLTSNPIRKAALDLSRETGLPVATAPIRLVRGTEPQAGFFLCAPVYSGQTNRSDTNVDQNHLLGYVLGVFRLERIIEEVLSSREQDGMQLRVEDLTVSSDRPALLYESPGFVDVDDPLFMKNMPLRIGERDWRLGWSLDPAYLRTQRTKLPWAILFAGLIMSAALGYVMHRNQLSANTAIEAERALAQQAQILRTYKFATDHTTEAVYWVREDSSFFYVNNAACKMLGYSREQLLNLGVVDIDPKYPPHVWAQTLAQHARPEVYGPHYGTRRF